MKSIIAFLFMVPIFANAGSISCIVDNGKVITAQIDGEANIENFKMLDVTSNENTDLVIEGMEFSANKMNLRFRTEINGESIPYVIRVGALNTLSKATYHEDSSAPDLHSASCLVNFSAGL